MFDEEMDFDLETVSEEDFDFDVEIIDDDNIHDEILAMPKILKPKCVKYKNAQKFAREIDLDRATYALVTGRFVFGDFIEALVEAKSLKCSEIWLSTLGMGQNNIDSIGNIMYDYDVEKLNLIISNYFVSKEHRDLMPYLMQELSGLNVDVAIAGIHAKIELRKAEERNIVVSGSANLSSSNNVEQFMIIDDKELYDFNKDLFVKIMENYKIWDGISGKNRLTKELTRKCRARRMEEEVW